MADPGPTIQIPRWIQLVGLPVLAVLAYLLASTLGHALFLFLTASVIAFLLNPLVRRLEGVRVPRGLGVAIVYLTFAAAVVVIVVALATVVVDQTRSAAERIDDYVTEEDGRSGLTGAESDLDRLEVWLGDRGIDVELRGQTSEWLDSLSAGDISGYTQDAISLAQGAAISFVLLLFSIVLIIVISIYMLLDMPRLESAIDRRFPPASGVPLTLRIESALAGYVRGQLLLSTIIGASAGVGMWLLGALDLVPGAEQYALLFGLWTAVIEVIPYIGPWLSAVPPAIYALVVDPVWGFFWVAGIFVFIYQVEGHVVVPNVMASALRLHPLLVIFGLLAGGELYGIPGVLVALPTMAALRAVWEFFAERLRLERWDERGEEIPVGVEVEGQERPPPRVVSGG
jgi:predicted PurR-regulated permease PerM